jgi:hypothetical protein
VSVIINPDTVQHAQSYNKKAHCVNSGGRTLSVECARRLWEPTPPAGCT